MYKRQGYVALHDAFTRLVSEGTLSKHPLTDFCAAISVGVVGDNLCLDLPYVEDSAAEVDMNVVMTGSGKFIEVQGTAEGEPFDSDQLDGLVELAEKGIAEIVDLQRLALSHGSD